MKILNQRGQSAIEYILLLVVVVSLATAFMNSDTFKQFVGKDSILMQKLVRQMSYSYRHGREGQLDESDYDTAHETYYNKEEGNSRFFTPISAYP
jgi:hypothetical protein